MREAVIVSTARTGLAKSWRGALNLTHGATMGGHVVRAAMERAGVEPGEVEDVLMGCANPEGATGANIARQVALAAGDIIMTGTPAGVSQLKPGDKIECGVDGVGSLKVAIGPPAA